VKILAILHQPDAGPGVFAEAIAAAGYRLELWEPVGGEPAPDDLRPYAGVVTLGGAVHPDQDAAHPWLGVEKRLLARVLEQEIPLLGVCLGAELVAEAAGGASHRARTPEIGWYPVQATGEASSDPLIGPLPQRFDALEWHSYECSLPPGSVPLSRSESCLQAFRVGELAWGIQFHAEVTLEIFESWLNTYDEDPDAVELGIQPRALAAQTRRMIGQWNRVGRELCARFLEVAAGCEGGVPVHRTG
jgi:GMP synthase-like glutamine amidotransferase